MTVDIRIHGARGDTREIDDAVMWVGSDHLWSLSAAFSDDDVGRVVEVAGAGRPSAIHTQIVSVRSPTQATLQFAPPVSGSALALIWRRGLLAEVVHQDKQLFLRATVPAWMPGDVRRGLDLHLPSGVLRATIGDVVTPWFVRLESHDLLPGLPSKLAVSWDKMVFDASFRAGDAEITSATAGFHAEIDRFSAVLHGARPAPLVARIESISPKFARLSAQAAASVTSTGCYIGSDDSAAFRAALAHGRAVLMPPGLYLVDGDLVLPDGASLIGRSPRMRPRIRRTGGRVLFDLRGSQRVGIERLHLDGGFAIAAQGTLLDGKEHPDTGRPTRSLTISHCRFTQDPVAATPKERHVTAVGQSPSLCALQLRNAEEIVFADNEIQSLQIDLASGGGGRKITIARNRFLDSLSCAIAVPAATAMPIEDIAISDNEIRDSIEGCRIGAQGDTKPPRFAAIRRVSIRNNRIGGTRCAIEGSGFGATEDWVIENNTISASAGDAGIRLVATTQSPFVNLTVRGNRISGRVERAAIELQGGRFDGVWVTRNEIAVTGAPGIRVGEDGAMSGFAGIVVADNLVRSAPPGIRIGKGAPSGAIREQSNKLEESPE